MRPGYSRDHRPDSEQSVLALIVNQEGSPFSGTAGANPNSKM
jgi:transposase